MKYTIGSIISIIIGGFIGFFGVMVSVFADSDLLEQLITIAIILLIYLLVSGVWGLLLPKYSWKWGLIFAALGVLFLGFYMLNEFNPYYFIYMVLIIGFACLGAWGGSSITRSRKT